MDDEGRQRRLEALRQMAQQQLGTQESAADATAARGPGAPWLILVTLVVVCLIVAGVVVVRARAPQTAKQPTILKIAAASDNLACPKVLAWSQDSTRIAALGYTSACPDSGFIGQQPYIPGLVNVYDAASGSFLESFNPDAALPASLLQALQSTSTANAASSSNLRYLSLMWSPDGKKFALHFSVFTIIFATTGTGASTQVALDGLEIANIDGTQPQILMTPTTNNAAALIWDVSRGTSTPLADLPFALAYHWDAGGTLRADPPSLGGATPPPPALGPIGTPDGGASFTIWQPQVAEYLSQAFVNGQALSETPGAFALFPDTLAWSPDGRHLIDAVSFEGLVQPTGQPAPTAQALKDLQLDQVPRLPVRDAGLQQVFAGLAAPAAGGLTAAQIAWRPDGRMLAVQAQKVTPNVPLDTTVRLYDCTTGALRASLKPASTRGTLIGSAAAANGLANTLLWSPDGSRLLALDPLSATITVWGPGALPK